VLHELRKRWKKDRLADTTTRGQTKRKRKNGSEKFCRKRLQFSETHFSVLQQLEIAAPYIKEHLLELHRDNIGRTEAWIMKEHQRVFTTWLMDKEIPIEDMTMMMLASRAIKLCNIMAIIRH
jgi:hypothetical protein